MKHQIIALIEGVAATDDYFTKRNGPAVPRAGYLSRIHKFGMCCGQDEGLVNHHLVQCLLEGADRALDIVQLF